MTHTFPVPLGSDGGTTRDEDLKWLWDRLEEKAENPVGYVPSITEARVLERFDGGLVREILVRDRLRYRERVLLRPPLLVVFEQLDDPDVGEIRNELGWADDDTITYTFSAILRHEAVERIGGLLIGLENAFFDSARGSTNTLLLRAAAPAL